MSNVRTNAEELARKYGTRLAMLDAAIQRGLRRGAAKVDAEQVKNLSGTGAPGSTPVPVRKGTLRRGTFWSEGQRFAVVGNTAAYARAIHDGKGTEQVKAHTRKVKKVFGRDVSGFVIQRVPAHTRRVNSKGRPFLDDAAKTVDMAGEIAGEMRKAFAI